MSQPAVVQGDRITGVCVGHQIPAPSGVAPAPPMPFSSPVTQGCDPTVLIGGKPAAVVGASGMNTPPHVGLHASDPFAVPLVQQGRITGGSATVLIGGKPAARTGSTTTMCFALPGQLVGSQANVLIGG